ncbi:RNA polymerase sigma factor [Mucilaginibacter sp. OK098]|uniref:RNA polymerase sigma factor n=1 Tax=Mucilaginibacter sp. OK098 TaxID=1855297 RepID=UPI000916DAF6|nr:RNA polymerase sigma-70 factor [Mucilaginibacter sp. OK098]SHN35570.1 RNA polymerase sigma-70 factor, ECF subfamily [Mucilaginibacter sp. OK098]
MEAYKKLTDEQLVILLKKGDQLAFTEIYSRYAEKLAGFAASKLYSIDDSRDLLHDLFVAFWENRDNLNISSNLQSYLFTILRRRIVDKIRKNITREEYAVMLQSLTTPHYSTTEQRMVEKDLKQQIRIALNELPPRVHEIYHLSREENLNTREIAEKLNLSEQTVKNQLTIALKHLRQVLSNVVIATFVWWLL